MGKEMKNFFKPEDFVTCGRIYQDCADVANEKLNALIESAPLVQGWYPGTYPNGTWTSSEVIHNTSTHTARLVDIQEIKKECKHEPMRTVSFTMSVDQPGNEYYKHATKCQHCGVELIAEWKVKP